MTKPQKEVMQVQTQNVSKLAILAVAGASLAVAVSLASPATSHSKPEGTLASQPSVAGPLEPAIKRALEVIRHGKATDGKLEVPGKQRSNPRPDVDRTLILGGAEAFPM